MAETVYGTNDEGHVMSERVQSLASSIYKEFERMIKSYDEDVVKELMPLVVGILESLDGAFVEKQENEVELELLRDDNEQLLTQYEREKQLRKTADQKFLDMDDAREEESKELQMKIESLESSVRMLELKSRNAQDHIHRLDEKESEQKREYAKLHERYTDLFKVHVDHVERTKMFLGTEKIMDVSASPHSRSGFNMPALRPTSGGNVVYAGGDLSSGGVTPPITSAVSSRHPHHMPSLSAELVNLEKAELEEKMDSKEFKHPSRESGVTTAEKEQNTDSVPVRESGTATRAKGDMANMVTSPELEDLDDKFTKQTPPLPISSNRKRGNESSIFDELQDTEALGEVDDGAEITGMSKEVENLILENTELMATKNALNVVKDDLIAKVDELTSEQELLKEELSSMKAAKDKLNQRISELDEDLKRTREGLEREKNKASQASEEGEEDIPMAQRKRFTRVEMARVLMERNQYKERLMELQEAVRWTEMIRASREHPELAQPTKKKSSIWNFFSNLFSSSSRPPKRLGTGTVKYTSPSTSLRPSGDPNKRQRDTYNMGEKAKAYDFLQEEALNEKARREREKERKEQYKQVRAHVKKEDGRMQAYGWSLPAKFTPTKDVGRSSQVPVPVPVYCRPLVEKEPGMKLWCAAGVDLSGGRTPDGGSVVGASIFYSDPPSTEHQTNPPRSEVEKLNQELKDHEEAAVSCNKQRSSLVWICTTTHNSSQVTVVDANNPADVLDMFHVTASHILCIASVPGALESDYTQSQDTVDCDEENSEGNMEVSGGQEATEASPGVTTISTVQCATGRHADTEGGETGSVCDENGTATDAEDRGEGGEEKACGEVNETDPLGATTSDQIRILRVKGSPSTSAHSTPNHLPSTDPRLPAGDNVKDGTSQPADDINLMTAEAERATSILSTMWLGTQSGSLYVHSAVSQWKKCLHSVKLKDSVLAINFVRGRVFVAQANGSVAVFHRGSGGQWDLTNYHLLDLGKPFHSVRCMCVVANKHVWCGYTNKIHVLDPQTLKLKRSFDAHPRRESQIRQLAWVGDGVWVSIRLDSTLRLYHAYTYQHLQDVDIEPYVSKMLGTGKLGFSFVRITALHVSCNRLWIGTGNGVIISVPLTESNKQSVTSTCTGRPGGVIRVYSDTKTDQVTPGTFIPYCTMAQAQLSFHGHRDAVKFFVSVPGVASKSLAKSDKSTKMSSDSSASSKNSTILVISGGEGYIDFRIGDSEEESTESHDSDDNKSTASLTKLERSHLIVWQVFNK